MTLGKRLRDSVAAFAEVFGNPNLRHIQLAWASAILGHWAYLVAVSVFAYAAGGAGAVGVLVVIRTVPAAVVAPFAGSIADRYDRKLVMISSSLVRAALIALGGLGILAEVAPELIYAIAGLAMLVGTPFRPALAATTPAVIRSPGELTASNAVTSTIESLAVFAGPALAGLLLAVASTEVVFFITASTFVLSALFVSRLVVSAENARGEAGERQNIFSETAVGFRTVIGDSRLRLLLGLFSAKTMVAGAYAVLVVVLALDLLEVGDSGVGYLNSAWGVGALVGSIAALSLVGTPRLSPAVLLGVALWGVPLVLIGLVPTTALALVLLAVIGVGNSLVDVATFTLTQRVVPDDVLARVFGVIQMLWILTFGIGGIVVVPLIDGFGAEAAFVVVGAFLPVLVLLAGPRLLALDRAAEAPVAGLALLQQVSMFSSLPSNALEQLARHLIPLEVAAGTVVVREGDRGDRFYLIAEGEVDVVADGREISQLGAGDYFGEIALIRDVPRTATVTARTPVSLHALEREDFLAAVTGYAASAEAAERVVGASLADLSTAGARLSA